MKDLTKGNPIRLIFEFAVPLFIGNVFQLFYNLMDTRIVGRTLGDQALAAVGATGTMNNLIVGFLIGLTNGFAISVAKSFGAQDESELRKDVATGLQFGVIITILLTVVSVTLLGPILRALQMPDELMAGGMAYIRVILLGMMGAMLYNVCASVLRAIGDTFTPLLFLILSTFTNIGLDYLFILYFKMGVQGAALATVVSQFGAACLCFIYIIKKYPILHLHIHDFKWERRRIVLLLKAGFSMGLMQSLVSLGTVILQSAINKLGTTIIVAHTGARRITELFMLPFSVFGMVIATYCSQNLGAGEIERIKIGIHKVLKGCLLWCGCVIIASYTIAPFLVKLITATEVQEVIDTATLYLRVDTIFYFITVYICILRNALQGIGDHITPIVSSMLELIGKTLVVILLTPKLKYWGIIVAEPIVWAVMVIPLLVKIKNTAILKQS